MNDPALRSASSPWRPFWALATMYVFSMFYRVSTTLIATDLTPET